MITRAHARRVPAAALSSLMFLAATLGPLAGADAATGARTVRVSVSSSEKQSPNGAIYPSISGTGRFAAFETNASNLVKGDTNAESDVFVRDRANGTTERVSVRSNGNQGNSWSGYSAISANGRFVTFTAEASNLVRGDGNGAQDVFVHDRRTGLTTRISVSSRGREGNGDSAYSSISANGRFVAFVSAATNLVRGDMNGHEDLFLRDRTTGTTTLISVSTSGEQADASQGYLAPGTISADGRYIAFASNATNLVNGDTNGERDVFVHDRVTHKTRRVSVSSTGDEGNGYSTDPAISGNGRFISFSSAATNLIGNDTNGYEDIFFRDLAMSTTRRVSISSAGQASNLYSSYSSVSADGRYVVFDSYASNLVGGDTNSDVDVFLRDRRTGKTRLISVSTAGAQGDVGSNIPFLSANGRFVVFQSSATNLVGGDTNARGDVFVRGPLL